MNEYAIDTCNLDPRHKEKELLTLDGKKKCQRCNKIKYLDDFAHNKHTKDGYESTCSECRNVLHKKLYNENKDFRYKCRIARMYGINNSQVTPELLETGKQMLMCKDSISEIRNDIYNSCDVGKSTIQYRLHNGATIEEALLPVEEYTKKRCKHHQLKSVIAIFHDNTEQKFRTVSIAEDNLHISRKTIRISATNNTWIMPYRNSKHSNPIKFKYGN
jgi:hypothetical protein